MTKHQSQRVSSKTHTTSPDKTESQQVSDYDNADVQNVNIEVTDDIISIEDHLDNKAAEDTEETKISGQIDQDCSTKEQSFHPFVHWAQSQTHISLRVDLTQVENLNTCIDDKQQKFTLLAKGKGAQGLQNYYFSLDFHSKVESKFDCHTIERYILILIRKQLPTKWPRLTLIRTKLPWLRIDFDRYTNEDSDEGSDKSQDDDELSYSQQSCESEKQQEKTGQNSSWAKSLDNIFNNKKTNSDIFNPFNKPIDKFKETSNMKYDHRKDDPSVVRNRNSVKQLDYKKTYLFLYNLVMFTLFLKVYIVLLVKYLSGTMDDEILKGAAFIIKLLTYTQLLESLHPILGLVPGGPLMPFTQVIGRILVNHFLIDNTIRLNSAPYAHYLFIVWCSIEIFRYPFYALRVFKMNIYSLTWCRYTLFLPLYPMGGFFESMVILSTIKHYEKTGEYSLSLPNSANISFSLTIFLKIYTFLLLGPTILYLMKYMWRQRSKQLKEKED